MSVERDAEEQHRREVASTLRRVQGLEVHAQVNAVKFDQRLARLDGAKMVKVDDLERVYGVTRGETGGMEHAGYSVWI